MSLPSKVLFDSFPKQDEFLEAAFDPGITFTLYGGAIRGGKTFAGLGALVLFCLRWPGSRWAVVRTDSITLKRNTLPAWDKIKPTNILRGYNGELMLQTFNNGSQILFFPENFHRDKELNRWKGLEVNGFLLEEINELQEISYNKAIERAGSYIIPDVPTASQPPPIILGTCNPTFGWVKRLFYDPWKVGRLPDNIRYIHSTIHDNPHIPQAFKENLKTLPRYEYEVFVNGNWDVQLKTGGEFFKAFELQEHLAAYRWDPEIPIHVSVDSNVYPYIAITVWILEELEPGNWLALQVGEIPAKDPKNTASAAGREVVRWLRRRKYAGGKVYIYGDPTTRARNTIDDDKKSFLDKFTDKISARYQVQKRMFRQAPPVAQTGDFINAIYEGSVQGVEVKICETCKESINDYLTTKEDKDGKILKKRITDPKTGISYEPNGHLSDTKRYFLLKAFYSEFRTWQNRFSDPADYHIPTPNKTIRGGI